MLHSRSKDGRTCPQCGDLKDPRANICKACYRKVANPPHKEKQLNYTSQQGYVMVYSPEHSRRDRHGYVDKSVLVWEDHYKQPIPDGYIIHHKNEIKGDDQIENLELREGRDHKRLHAGLKQRNRIGRFI